MKDVDTSPRNTPGEVESYTDVIRRKFRDEVSYGGWVPLSAKDDVLRHTNVYESYKPERTNDDETDETTA